MAGTTGKSTGANRACVTMAYGDRNGPTWRNLAANVDHNVAGVEQNAVGNPNRISVAGYAIALVSDD